MYLYDVHRTRQGSCNLVRVQGTSMCYVSGMIYYVYTYVHRGPTAIMQCGSPALHNSLHVDYSYFPLYYPKRQTAELMSEPSFPNFLTDLLDTGS